MQAKAADMILDEADSFIKCGPYGVRGAAEGKMK